ncbi:hypothetical protein F5Y19DRAFT_227709 [Xylariaceae sp. FL1651]|nr:hypothetical protein F5Y19DRAFT_227709 [Xylariaceae sp. FL1651]
MGSLDRFQEPWINAIKPPGSFCATDFPSYPSVEPESLICTSHPVSFEVGTGASIYTRSLLPAILNAKREVVLVTCFWAPSSTLTALRETLEQLAKQRKDLIRSQRATSSDGGSLSLLKIRICFSSRSLFQKLFHPCSRNGYTYPSSKWVSKLGLPDPKILEAGLIDLQVKSLFFLPFSVMHPKYLVIDRQRAWLPSCNVSWEPWLEGCIEITGEAVASLLRFHHSVWDLRLEADGRPPIFDSLPQQLDNISSPGRIGLTSIQSPVSLATVLRPSIVPTVLLPSSHHRNPQFRPLPWQHSPRPPMTALNCAIIHLFTIAEKHIYLQTPNLTSAAVFDALLHALNRGVNVTVITSKGVMVLEQMLTGGTTTSWCLRSFIKLYTGRRKHLARMSRVGDNDESNAMLDIEAQSPRLGSLEIFQFHSLPANQLQQIQEEPVHSHLKLTIVDDEYIVLGSGNMDRASWFTSQELGILFQSNELVASVNDTVSQALQGRLSLLFSSKK